MNISSIPINDFIKIVSLPETLVVDVREPDEVAFEKIPSALNVPLSSLEKLNFQGLKPDQSIYLTCQSGSRSLRAAEILAAHGFYKLINISGGINAFKKAGGKVIRQSRVIPLMRQVQITAGFLVVSGVVLSRLLHPGFIFLSGFVGLGLIFAGVTGLCPMARFLTVLPWNRSSSLCSSEVKETTPGGCCS